MVKAISSKEKFPDQEADLKEKFEMFKGFVQIFKDKWPFKYEYWNSHWGIEE